MKITILRFQQRLTVTISALLLLSSPLALSQAADSATKPATKSSLATLDKQALKTRLKDFYVADIILFHHKQKPATKEGVLDEAWLIQDNFHWPEQLIDIKTSDIASFYPKLEGVPIQWQPRVDGDVDSAIDDANTSEPLKAGDKSNPSLPLLDKRFSSLNQAWQKMSRVRRYGPRQRLTWLQYIPANMPVVHFPTPLEQLIKRSTSNKSDAAHKQAQVLPFANNPFITGHFSLSRGRFLHLSTDLWLVQLKTQDESNKATQAALLENAPLSDALMNDGEGLTPAVIENESHWPDIALHIKTDAMASDSASPQSLELNEDIIDESDTSRLLAQGPNFTTLSHEHIEYIAPMREKRKMRSKEVHYIDHPLFGMVVYFEPLYELLEKRPELLETLTQ